MAGTAVTTQEVRKYGGTIAERNVEIVFTSDASDGTVPDEELTGLENYNIDEVITLPDGTAPPSTVYRVLIVDADGGTVFLGSNRSLTAKERQPAYEHNGKTPAIDSTITVKLVTTDGATAVTMGNSEIVTVTLKLKRK